VRYRIRPASIARVYRVADKVVHAWLARDLDVMSPVAVMDAIAKQRRTGSVFTRLCDPAERERITEALDALRSTSPTV
jgi:hypothetical protein